MNAATSPPIGGNLFTDYFLREGMPQTAEWRALNPAEVLHVADAMRGHTGPPFAWDEEARLHLRARLDALFFLLYGRDRDAARYILSTFPIVREEEEARYQGRFRSRDLILGYMAAFAAGDPSARVAC